ncbi:MAG: KAP family P-loop NTPase fold protein [Gammaproteobacteria bacterium]
MNDQAESSRAGFSVTRQEQAIDPTDPWQDDVLERRKVADTLTQLVSKHSEPLTISLSGSWGTGKTFLLKRWQQQLQNDKYQAIYFNAWEDDFQADPLVAILGQLPSHFKSNAAMNEIINGIISVPVQLLHNYIGVDITKTVKVMSNKLLEDYHKKAESKEKLRKELTKMSEKVKKETDNPLIFIIDELDRCRPNFAIHLLERIKHIFNIPNMVFVLGMNRDELSKSIASVYGDIDANTYLHRFFDLQFLMQPPDSTHFCKELINEYQIKSVFSGLTEASDNEIHYEEFQIFSHAFPVICSSLALSLRDIEHYIKSIAFVAKTIPLRYYMRPVLISALIIVRLKNPELYRIFAEDNCFASELVDYLYKQLSILNIEIDDGIFDIFDYLTVMEGQLYQLENFGGQGTPISQLNLLKEGKPLTRPEVLHEGTRKLARDDPKLDKLLNQRIFRNPSRSSKKTIFNLIELSSSD